MTIGPEPITRIDEMSSRLGIRLQKLYETVKQIGSVVWSSCGLGVVLDAEGWLLQQRDALHAVVIEVDVGDASGAERRVERALDRRVHREPVVVRGDLDFAGGQVLDRLIDPPMAVAEF